MEYKEGDPAADEMKNYRNGSLEYSGTRGPCFHRDKIQAGKSEFSFPYHK